MAGIVNKVYSKQPMSPKKGYNLVPKSLVEEADTRDLGTRFEGRNYCLALLPGSCGCVIAELHG